MDDRTDGSIKERKVRRLWPAVVGTTLLVIALAITIVFWLQRPVEVSRDFDVAKITSAFVDGEPFMRQPLAAGAHYRPIELMAGTTVRVECFAVKLDGTKPKYLVTALGKTVESDNCIVDLAIDNQVGDYGDIHIEYREATAGLVDTLDIPIVTVQKSERVEFHQLQNEKHENVMAGGVPNKLYVYGRAITNLPGESSEYGALFFVADPANDVPVVQMMPMLQGDAPRPMIGRVARYRSYGTDLSGYAMWTPEMISINPVNRTVTDLYIGVFKMSEIDAVFKKLLKVEVTGEDTVTVTPLVSTPYEVMQMTVGHKLLSDAFHVVSGAGRVGNDVNTVPTVPVVPSAPAADQPAPTNPATEPAPAVQPVQN